MQLKNAPIFPALICFISGILFTQAYFWILPFLGIFLFVFKRRGLTGLYLLFFLLGIIIYSVQVLNFENFYQKNHPEQLMWVEGRIKKVEQRRALVDQIQTSQGETRGKLWFWGLDGEELSPGQKVRAKGRLEKPEGPSNPGERDWRKYNLSRGIWGSFRVEEDGLGLKGKERLLISSLRKTLQERLNKTLGKEYGGLLGALILGQRDKLSQSQIEKIYSSGLGHLFAVSGLHIGFIALLAWGIVEKLPLDQKYKTMIFGLCLFFYALLVGFRASVMRAVVLAFLFRLGKLLNRPGNYVNYLCVAGMIILIYNPFFLWDQGFQLSFLVTGFIFLGRPLFSYSQNRSLQLILVSLFATAAAAPLTIYYFNSFHPFNFIPNFFAIPITGITVISGLFGFIPIIGDLIWVFLSYPSVLLLERIMEVWGAVPFADLEIRTISQWGIALYYLIFILVLIWWEPTKLPSWRKIKSRWFPRILFLMLIVVLFISIINTFGKEDFRVTFLDVGQGDAMHLEIPEVGDILIDGGGERGEKGSGVGERVLLPYLNYRGVNTLQAIFISHFHEDHYRGLIPVIERIIPNRVFGPPLQNVWQEEEFLGKLSQQNVSYQPLTLEKRFKLGENNYMQILHPSSDLIPESALNNNSLVLFLEYEGWRFLFTGDLEEEGENEMLAKGLIPTVDVLKVAHHGSSTSTQKEFLKKADPLLGIICVGVNPFGHPCPQVIERMKRQGVKVFSTKDKGAIILTFCDHGSLKISAWKEKERDLIPLREMIIPF